MNPKGKEAFTTWYASKKESNYMFNFQQEILAYCLSDIDILRRCCLDFRDLFYNVTDINAFTTLTITLACHLVYCTNYLPKDRLPSFRPWDITKKRQSLFAHKWLSYTAKKHKIYIQHARDGLYALLYTLCQRL